MAVTPRQAGVVAAAFILGGVAAIAAQQLTKDTGTNPATETVATGGATLDAAGAAPVALGGEVVVLPDGYIQQKTPDSPTLTLVETGKVEVRDASGTRSYLAGSSFTRPAGTPYTIAAVGTSRLATVRLLSAR